MVFVFVFVLVFVFIVLPVPLRVLPLVSVLLSVIMDTCSLRIGSQLAVCSNPNSMLLANIHVGTDDDDDDDDDDNTYNDDDNTYNDDVFGFRVKIVLTYRHFFQWLPSYHYQIFNSAGGNLQKEFQSGGNHTYQTHYRYVPGIVDFIEDFLLYDIDGDGKSDGINGTNCNGNGNGNGNQTHHCHSIPQIHKYRGLSGSLFAYQKWTTRPELYHRIDIFDLHQQLAQPQATTIAKTTTTTVPPDAAATSSDSDPQHLFANFCCQVLPSATRTCRFLQEDAASNHSKHGKLVRVGNDKGQQMVTAQDTARILQEARLRVPHLLDDAVANAIAKNAKANTISVNQQLTIRIERWFNTTTTTTTTNTKKRVVPKTCPSEQTLVEFRKRSLDFLGRMVGLVRKQSLSRRQRKTKQQQRRQRQPGEFDDNDDDDDGFDDLFRSSSSSAIGKDQLLLSRQYHDNNFHENENDKDRLLPPHIVAAHDASFDEYVAKGKFCQIDLDKLFEDGEGDGDGFVRYVFAPRTLSNAKSRSRPRRQLLFRDT